MTSDLIKVNLSSFVTLILMNDALAFGFRRGDSANINGLINKVMPNLLQLRKYRRDRTQQLLREAGFSEGQAAIEGAVNAIIDAVYFSDAELSILDDIVWIRPTRHAYASFEEIADAETEMTGLPLSVYIRGILNEYARLPQYKREALVFDEELSIAAEACLSGRILHYTRAGCACRLFAYQYLYGFAYDQTNYIVGYDLITKRVCSVPLHEIRNAYLVAKKYRPGHTLLAALKDYTEQRDFHQEIAITDEEIL